MSALGRAGGNRSAMLRGRATAANVGLMACIAALLLALASASTIAAFDAAPMAAHEGELVHGAGGVADWRRRACVGSHTIFPTCLATCFHAASANNGFAAGPPLVSARRLSSEAVPTPLPSSECY